MITRHRTRVYSALRAPCDARGGGRTHADPRPHTADADAETDGARAARVSCVVSVWTCVRLWGPSVCPVSRDTAHTLCTRHRPQSRP